MSYKAKARVKVVTEAGKWYLAEIKGLKEGTIVEGIYNPLNRVRGQCFGLARMEN